MVLEDLHLLSRVGPDVVAKDFHFVAFITLHNFSSTSFLILSTLLFI